MLGNSGIYPNAVCALKRNTTSGKIKNIFLFVFYYAIINMSEVSPVIKNRFFGRVAQLGERLVRNEEVVGSIPITSTI